MDFSTYVFCTIQLISPIKMQNILAFSVILAVILSVCSAAVSLDELMGQQDPPTDTAAADALATLEEMERETFEEIIIKEKVRPRSSSPKKCCKIGKRVAEKGLYCNIDLMLVQKKNNGVFKRKMKWQGPEEAGHLQYKDLLLRAEKCYPSKASRSMFTKCCEWQSSIQDELENCKQLRSREERKNCRRQVKSRE